MGKMQVPQNQISGFGRVNSLLGSSSTSNVCQYVWDENSVVLKNSYFDEEMFRRVKLAGLIDNDSCLSINELKEIVDRVLDEHPQLLLDISYASPENWKELDRQLDSLLGEAVIAAEHEAQLRISRDNIKQARPLIDGWMSYQDVNAMVALAQKRKFDSPDRGKFVNRSRH